MPPSAQSCCIKGCIEKSRHKWQVDLPVKFHCFSSTKCDVSWKDAKRIKFPNSEYSFPNISKRSGAGFRNSSPTKTAIVNYSSKVLCIGVQQQCDQTNNFDLPYYNISEFETDEH
ncbi:hypothetical protein PV327_004114 [Microctonus hyperodae]|uniref:THAP-type domain-containing protein n=1 Tax=Microctonus hyperodae TaxID=165561 RepID=A0AA39FBQ7_MICHY|nr:hypothetical protein PV327_004114 [Microctonus hyperodae]